MLRQPGLGPGCALTGLEAVRHGAQRESLDSGERFLAGLGVGEDTGRIHDLGQPAPIFLLLELHAECPCTQSQGILLRGPTRKAQATLAAMARSAMAEMAAPATWETGSKRISTVWVPASSGTAR